MTLGSTEGSLITSARNSKLVGVAAHPHLIGRGEAIAILAGQVLSPHTNGAYERWYQRIERERRSQRLSDYRLPGRREIYFARDAILTLAGELSGAGVTNRGSHRRTKAAKREQIKRRDSLIPLPEAAKRLELKPASLRSRVQREMIAAVRIDGQLFFRPDLLDAAPARAKRSPVKVQCEKCGREFSKAAYRVARTKRHFCPKCGRRAGPLGRKDSEQTRARKRAALQTRWRSGELEQVRENIGERGKSWGRKAKWPRSRGEAVAFVERISKMTQKRYGHPLSDERKAMLIDQALKRARPHYHRGRKPTGIGPELRCVADQVLASHVESEDLLEVSQSELLAEVGLVAWQKNLGTFRRDFPGSALADCYAPEWRNNVIERVRRHVGDHIKGLQDATT